MTFDSVDAVVVWPKVNYYKRQKAFFFKEDKYLRYDIELDREDFGYPQPIIDGWKGLFPGGKINAALLWPRKVEGRRKAYFFSGKMYARWDVDNDKLDRDYPKSIAGNWKLPDGWDEVDAALEWDENIVYFFKRRYSVGYSTEEIIRSGAREIGALWPGVRTSGINAAVKWPATAINGDREKAYFFWDKEYIRYDVKSRRPDGDYPKKIQEGWPGPLDVGVWTSCKADIPIGRPCLDARLGGRPDSPRNLDDTDHKEGQGGWDMGFEFIGLDDLAEKLFTMPTPEHVSGEPLRPGQVKRLAINAHGGPGLSTPWGQEKYFKDSRYALTAHNIDLKIVKEHLLRIAEILAPDATVYLMGCECGQGEPGSDFLRKLSTVWPGRKVVGFTHLGYMNTAAQRRRGTWEECYEPGMRDTQFGVHEVPGYKPKEGELTHQQWYDQNWNRLDKMPWCSENIKHAKTAVNGKIDRDNTGEGR